MKNFKAYFLFLICLFSIGLSTHAQSNNKLKFTYFSLSGQGIKTSNNGTEKTVNIKTIGGLIEFDFSKINTNKNLIVESYFNSDKTIRKNANQVFLKVGDEYTIEIKNKGTNELVQQFIIHRIIQIPNLDVVLIDKNGKRSINLNDNKEITTVHSISPKTIEINPSSTTETLEIAFKLRNLKTQKTLNYNWLATQNKIELDGNSDYELLYYNVLQPETAGTLIIKTEVIWYKNTDYYIILGVLLILAAFYFINRKMKKKVSISETERKKLEASAIRLQSMLNPHFTFNALSTVQGLMNTGRIDEANQYLEEFGSLLRKSLAKSQSIFNSLDQELEMMRMYLRIESLRFNFEWDIKISEDLYTSEIEIPTLLIQPIIENSIKHGLKNNKSAKIIVECKKQDDNLNITVTDNGNWKDGPSGYGLKNTKERIDTINNMSHNKAIMLSFDTKIGTTVNLNFFNWLKYD